MYNSLLVPTLMYATLCLNTTGKRLRTEVRRLGRYVKGSRTQRCYSELRATNSSGLSTQSASYFNIDRQFNLRYADCPAQHGTRCTVTDYAARSAVISTTGRRADDINCCTATDYAARPAVISAASTAIAWHCAAAERTTLLPQSGRCSGPNCDTQFRDEKTISAFKDSVHSIH